GQSRGFGFVHFEEASTARAAAEAMHGKALEGRTLVVRVRSEPASSGPAPTRLLGPSIHDNVNTMYVTALNATVTEATLRTLFEAYGKVTDVRLIIDKATGMSKGYAFVTMSSPEEMLAAITGAN
ncbi:uncharacterized protein HaLaN_10929, partial [Haematococcus lacustris]